MSDVHAGLLGDDRAGRAGRAARAARARAAEGARRLVVGAVVSGAAAGLVGWLVGMHTVHAVLLALAVAGTVVVASTFDPRPDERWSREPLPDGHGARTELAHLSWTMRGRDGRVGERVVRRLRQTAASRLARVGLRLDEPADDERVAELLGPRAWAALNPTGGRMPRLADVEHAVTRLERLVAEGTDVTAATDAPPRPRP